MIFLLLMAGFAYLVCAVADYNGVHLRLVAVFFVEAFFCFFYKFIYFIVLDQIDSATAEAAAHDT